MTAPALRLAATDRAALALLWDAEQSCGGPGSGYAWASPNGTQVHEASTWRQVAVDRRTVQTLLAQGLVDVESYEHRWDDVTLTDAGRAIATADHSFPLAAP